MDGYDAWERSTTMTLADRQGWQRAGRLLTVWLVLGCWLTLLGSPPVAQAAGVLAGRTIVLNPEEGGSNPGGISGGIEEKTVNLATTLDVGALLRQAGAHVVYTRTTDVAVRLPARAALANQAQADAFVTLAANAINDPAVSGVVTYFGGPSGYAGGLTRPAGLVEQGRLLAQAVQTGVVQTTGAVDRGVQPANFYVLGYATMPAILIETGFMTNPAEAQLLATARYQQTIAEGIVTGLTRFFRGQTGTAVLATGATPGLYTVQPGDTLSGLAARFGVSVTTLLQRNGLNNANDLFAGQILTVPTGSAARIAAASTPSGSDSAAGRTVVVQSGDTLSGLALRYDVSPGALAALNGLPNEDRLLAATTLRVPAPSESAPDVGA